MPTLVRWIISVLQVLAALAAMVVAYEELTFAHFVLVVAAAVVIVTAYVELTWNVKTGDDS